jgi:hypothetical protein
MMEISFIIITNGKKKTELLSQVYSITKQDIPKYEIIICGDINSFSHLPISNSNIRLIENKVDAERGSLGGLRNTACKAAKFENLVISDDDMLFPSNWYTKLIEHGNNFEILTTCIRNPDGTRFWDNACYQSPKYGHINLNYDEQDDYLYMSGGQSWLIKKSIWENIKWDEELLIYKMNNLIDYSKGGHNEDTDFSLRCRSNNIKIKHCNHIVVYHNDTTYTGIGRMVRRRSIYKNQEWCQGFLFPEKIGIEFAIQLFNYGFHAESADLLRFYITEKNSFLAKEAFDKIEAHLGGQLENSNYNFFYDKEYLSIINTIPFP